MHDCLYVRPRLVDSQMHIDLTGDVAGTRQLVTIHIHHHQIIGANQTLGTSGWRCQNARRIKPDGQVSGGTRSKTQRMQIVAEASQLLPQLRLAAA